MNLFSGLFERRSVGSSYALLNSLARGNRSLAGVDVSEATAMQVAAVWTCVDLLARSMASLPLDVYERLDERTRRPAANHPLRRVLSKPNSWQTTSEWVGQQMAHLALRGNAYNAIIRSSIGDRDQVVELLPLHPDQVSVEQAGYPNLALSYTWRDKHGKAWPFKQSEILHLRGMTTNGVVGRSVLDDARESMGVALATQQHAATFWKDGGLPTAVLKHPKTLSPKAKESLETGFAKTYGGGADQRRVAVLEEGMELTTLSLSSADAQFLETRKFTRSEIAGLFHVPPHMIGDTEKSTSWGTGIEQQQIGFLTFTLAPWVVAFEQRMNRDLILFPDKYYVKFAVNAFMRGDAATRGQFYRVMREIGAYSANDIRRFEDENPIENGDTYLQPANLSPLGSGNDTQVTGRGTAA